MTEEAENRKSQRWDLRRYLKVNAQDDDQVIGYLVDINQEGLKLASAALIPVQWEAAVRIQVVSEQICLNICSLWCNKDGDSDLYLSGWRIISPSAAAKSGVLCLIEALKTGNTNQ